MLVPPPITSDPDVARTELLTELWVVYTDRETPPAVKVAALDKIGKIQGAYAPVKVDTNPAKFRSLADFYASVDGPEPSAEEEEE